ncbi:MAG: nucleotide sugar dehydrogenase [Gammaproteobacteria bacterium]
MKIKTKITVVGSGYVGMSLSALLSISNKVTILDIDSKRIKKINNRESTVEDNDIKDLLQNKNISIRATDDKEEAYKSADFIIIATPTNYDPKSKHFDTKAVDDVVNDAITHNKNALIVIKSTIPIGHTASLQNKFKSNRIIFSPEFLREGQALNDNFFPSRIIVGDENKLAYSFSSLLKDASKKDDVDILHTTSSEAEAIKLFANSYLAMRVAFFNELDTFALSRNLKSINIINGICLDDRIGMGYNNPSFGYGGYCLPKDTKQLLAEFNHLPQSLIGAIVSSNSLRKDYIAQEIIKTKSKVVGFYKLAMKEGSDNFRSASIIGLIERIKKAGKEIAIFEPSFNGNTFHTSKVYQDLDDFKNVSDVIVTNRQSNELKDVEEKCFTRDLFCEN